MWYSIPERVEAGLRQELESLQNGDEAAIGYASHPHIVMIMRMHVTSTNAPVMVGKWFVWHIHNTEGSCNESFEEGTLTKLMKTIRDEFQPLWKEIHESGNQASS
jgi:hypothetical protein